jgi:hypothetical protein
MGVTDPGVFTHLRCGQESSSTIRSPIEPFSMARPDPNTAVRRKIEFASSVIPAAAQAAMLLGPGFKRWTLPQGHCQGRADRRPGGMAGRPVDPAVDYDQGPRGNDDGRSGQGRTDAEWFTRPRVQPAATRTHSDRPDWRSQSGDRAGVCSTGIVRRTSGRPSAIGESLGKPAGIINVDDLQGRGSPSVDRGINHVHHRQCHFTCSVVQGRLKCPGHLAVSTASNVRPRRARASRHTLRRAKLPPAPCAVKYLASWTWSQSQRLGSDKSNTAGRWVSTPTRFPKPSVFFLTTSLPPMALITS